MNKKLIAAELVKIAKSIMAENDFDISPSEHLKKMIEQEITRLENEMNLLEDKATDMVKDKFDDLHNVSLSQNETNKKYNKLIERKNNLWHMINALSSYLSMASGKPYQHPGN